MKLFVCQGCGNTVHFENGSCLACNRPLGYAPSARAMRALEPVTDAAGPRPVYAEAGARAVRYVYCTNAEAGVCNWLVEEGDPCGLCRSCRHTKTAPDLSEPGNRERWARLERAKRHLFYSLLAWGLPAPAAGEGAAEPLVFDLLGDVQTAEGVRPILTGHDFGLITLNIAEADDDLREQRRVAMGEPYRTLLGHFRHEIGHYYWDILVNDAGPLDAFRALFGDERRDYAEALQRHYVNGPPQGWQASFISAYATAHPWEDFAETWAHYMHIVDTLETAASLGIALRPGAIRDEALHVAVDFDAYRAGTMDDILAAWTAVSVAINSLSRSLGQADAYPFVLSQAIVAKLAFVHALIRSHAPSGEA